MRIHALTCSVDIMMLIPLTNAEEDDLIGSSQSTVADEGKKAMVMTILLTPHVDKGVVVGMM